MPIEKVCENCKQPFYCYPSEAEKGRKFCSLTCRGNHLGRRMLTAGQTPVGFTCANCAKPFTMTQSYLTAYRKKFDRDPQYCSMGCSADGRRKTAENRHKFNCAFCGKEQNKKRRKQDGRLYLQQKFCDNECKAAYQRQTALEKFNRGEFGRHIKKHGYVWISVPSLVTGKRHAMLEHRHVMSKHLGRDLFTEETVHHRDGNRQNNALDNLELFSSRHGPGQRVVDKVQFAIEILTLYPDFAKTAGYELRKVGH